MGRYSDGDEPGRCTAMSKQTRERCKRPKVRGRAVCRYHGAFGGRPFTHGRRSKIMGRFRKLYEDALADPALLDLREIIAQFDLIVSEALRRLHEADTPDFRKQALDLWRKKNSKNLHEAEQAEEELGKLLKKGCSADVAFKQYISSLSTMARHVEKAWDIRLDAAQVINARDLRVILARFATIVVSRAPEKASDILEDIEREIALGMSARTMIGVDQKHKRQVADKKAEDLLIATQEIAAQEAEAREVEEVKASPRRVRSKLKT